MGGGKEVKSPAEYSVFNGKQLLARIVKMGDGWRACKPSEVSAIGLAVSPIGMNKFREVRQWAISKLKG